MKEFNRVALLDFLNVIGQNGSNYVIEMSHYARVVRLKRMYPPFYRCFSHNGQL